MSNIDYKELFEKLTNRYSGASPEALISVLCPMLIPISVLDKKIVKLPGQSHYRATFHIDITEHNQELITVGRTGKFVPQEYVLGDRGWKEIAKGRFIELQPDNGIAVGEVYVGNSSKKVLETALDELSQKDYLEIAQYGAAAKVLSSLVEFSMAEQMKQQDYSVKRMPEDMAKHLGNYRNYDFELTKDGITKKVEVKSLWGTDTTYARLIHSKTKDYETSSCKFATQDIFAVSLFLRTGNIHKFAFARSVSKAEQPHGLPTATGYPDYVLQNPVCKVGNGIWFSNIDDVWSLG